MVLVSSFLFLLPADWLVFVHSLIHSAIHLWDVFVRVKLKWKGEGLGRERKRGKGDVVIVMMVRKVN